MKKSIMFYFIVVLMIIILCITASAGTIDFSGYSDEELMETYRSITQEIADRKIEKVAHLSAGVYIGGIDIPVGEYLLYIDNSNGVSDVPVRYIPKTQFLTGKAIMGKLNAGCSYQNYIDIQNNDELSVGIDFDLIIKPRGMITFE